MKKIIYIDLDNTICDYTKSYKMSNLDYPQSELGFFSNLEPIDYALPCVAQLQESGKFEVWFATAPSIKNTHAYTEKAEWILEYLGESWLKKLIIIPDKSKLIGDYLIDDVAFDEITKQQLFDGELIHFGSKKFENWIDVTAYLLNQP